MKQIDPPETEPVLAVLHVPKGSRPLATVVVVAIEDPNDSGMLVKVAAGLTTSKLFEGIPDPKVQLELAVDVVNALKGLMKIMSPETLVANDPEIAFEGDGRPENPEI